ncbi:MAG: hypothetical protein SVG88_06720 [Halobacteriales archaeon]|nr:hypothetical protein [Halobacteriales archaeon]
MSALNPASRSWNLLRQWIALPLVAVLLGTTVGGLLAHTLLYQYGSLPVPYLVGVSPLVGLLLYWWTDSLWEVLVTLFLVTIVAFLTAVAVFSTPLYVLENTTVVESNLLLLNSIAQTILFSGLTAILLAVGIIIASFLFREGLLPDTWRAYRGQLTLQLAVVTLVVVLIGAGVTGTLVRNYGSAVEQGTEAVDVGEVTVVESNNQLRSSLVVRNRLAEPMTIDSYLVHYWINGSNEPLTDRGFPNRQIPAEDTGVVWVGIDADPAFELAGSDTAAVRITGFVYVTGFNGYRVRLDITEYRTVVRR